MIFEAIELFYLCRRDDNGIIKNIAAGIIFFAASCILAGILWFFFLQNFVVAACAAAIIFIAFVIMARAGYKDRLIKIVALAVISPILGLLTYVLFPTHPVISVGIFTLLLLFIMFILKDEFRKTDDAA